MGRNSCSINSVSVADARRDVVRTERRETRYCSDEVVLRRGTAATRYFCDQVLLRRGSVADVAQERLRNVRCCERRCEHVAVMDKHGSDTAALIELRVHI